MRKKKKKEELNIKFNLKMYFSFLFKYKLIFCSVLGLILFIEASFVADRFLFKFIIDYGNSLSLGEITIEFYIKLLFMLLGIYLVLGLFRGIAKFFQIHLINRMDSSLMLDLKQKFFNHILSLSHKFHSENKTGGLISKLIRSSGSIERMTDVLLFNVAPLLFSLIIVFSTIFYFNMFSAFAVLVTILVFIVYSLFIQKIQTPYNLDANKKEDYEKSMIADYFGNIESIKYFGKEKNIKKRFLKIIKSTKRSMILRWDYFRYFDAGQSIILTLGFLSVNVFSIMGFIKGTQSIGDFVFIYTTFSAVIGPLFGFVHGVRGFYQSMSDFDGLFKYSKIENDIKDQSNAKKLKVKRGEIIFKSVSFSYDKRSIIKKFNLTIPHDKKVALVGHSGCGKSTLIKLLYRLYDVKKGEILIDNVNIKNYSQESLRSEMSIVPQECALFDDTIYNNIYFSNPSAKRKDVLKAMKFAQLDKIVENFSEGYDTIVGERGVKLSGGEKQRVSIARAILANKKILVLDEATSALDSKTEHDIQKALAKLMKGRTSIIIAHRLSTIMNADLIVVMSKGKIVEMATHSELVSKRGHYNKLWELQKGSFEED